MYNLHTCKYTPGMYFCNCERKYTWEFIYIRANYHLGLARCKCILIFYKRMFFSSPEPKAQGELIVYQSSRRLSVCLSVWLCVIIFKLEYLRNQWANRNEILSEPSLGWEKGCIRFWARSNRNSGVHGNG